MKWIWMLYLMNKLNNIQNTNTKWKSKNLNLNPVKINRLGSNYSYHIRDSDDKFEKIFLENFQNR